MAAGAQGIRAGRAFVEVGADLNPLDKGLNDAKNRLSAFSGALSALGSALALTFATSKITGWVQAFADSGKEIYVMARAAGISASEISELKAAVGLLGGDLGETVGAMRKMGIFLNDVATGGREATDALNELGLSLADLQGLSETDKLQKIGEQLAKIPLNARQALGRKIFGKGGGATVGIAAALGAARAETAGSGQTNAELKAAFDLAQALGALERAQKSVFKSIGAALAPGFQAVAKLMTEGAKGAKAWVKENIELIQKIALVGSVVVGISTALLGIATGIKLVGLAVAAIVSVFTGLWTVVSSLAALIVLPFAKLGISALVIPAVIYALGRFTGAFEAAGNAAAHLRDVFNTTFGGIKDAIAVGDLGKAWEITIAGMKVAWLDFRVWLDRQLGPTLEDVNPMVRAGRQDRQALLGFFGHQQVTERPGLSQESQTLLAQAQQAADELEAMNRDAFYHNWAAQAAQEAGLPDMNDIAEQMSAGSGRGTFNRDVLFGFGGTPMQQLISKTQAIVDRLEPLLTSIDQQIYLMGAATEVG